MVGTVAALDCAVESRHPGTYCYCLLFFCFFVWVQFFFCVSFFLLVLALSLRIMHHGKSFAVVVVVGDLAGVLVLGAVHR